MLLGRHRSRDHSSQCRIQGSKARRLLFSLLAASGEENSFLFILKRQQNQILSHWCPTPTISSGYRQCSLASSPQIVLLVSEAIKLTCSEARITQSKHNQTDKSHPTGEILSLLKCDRSVAMSYLLKMYILNPPVARTKNSIMLLYSSSRSL